MANSIRDYSLANIARILRGKVYGRGAKRYVQAPAPGHSTTDDSFTLEYGEKLDFVVKSHCGDDEIKIKDYVREKLSLPSFSEESRARVNGKRRPAKKMSAAPPIQPEPTPESINGPTPDDILEAALRGGGSRRATPENVPGLKFVEAYLYPNAKNELIYKNCRYLTDSGAGKKTFRPWRLVNGEWVMGLTGTEQVPYHLDEIAKNPHAPIVNCEGEKDTDNVRKLGYVATNVAPGQWQDVAKYFHDREIIILGDFNKAGTVRVMEAANALHGKARSIKIIFPPGLDGSANSKDVSDWLKVPGNDGTRLADICNHAPLWNPGDVIGGFAAAELVVPEKESDTPPVAPLKLTYFDECGAFIDKNEIFKGPLAIGETSGWIGPPGSGKSALLTEVSVHCVQTREWRGYKYKAKNPLGVLIIALERADLYKRRLHAYALRDKKTNLPIAIAGTVLDLLNPACIDIVVATVREAEKKFSRPVGLIIIDTYAKGIAANGGDEDKARDQNRAAVHLREIHVRISVHIALVGHTGKDESRGARGSNAHLGDVDLMSQINSDTEIKVVEITKANDAPMGIIAGFKIELFDLGPDSDGDQRQTSILDPNQYLATKKAQKRELSPKAKAALHSLFETIADGKLMPKPNDPHVPESVTSGTSLSHWRCDALSRGILNREGNNREEFKRIRVALINAGFIGVWEDFVWPVT
jgi:AAA domain